MVNQIAKYKKARVQRFFLEKKKISCALTNGN